MPRYGITIPEAANLSGTKKIEAYMSNTDQYYNKPVFRPGIKKTLGAKSAVFDYEGTSFDVEYSPELKPALSKFMAGMEKGLDFERFVSDFPAFGDYADQLLTTLDRYGFITEAAMPKAEKSISGKAFWKEIDKISWLHLAKATSPLAEAMQAKDVSSDILINYAVQYYHFVKAGPQIIAAALSKAEKEPVYEILKEFFLSELDHDKLLLKALEGAGVDPEKVRDSVPLPETFALITAYHVMAEQEPLSFYACLFLVEEEKPRFNEIFLEACRKNKLSERFYKPIISHSVINEEEEHGEITSGILAHYSKISMESRTVVLKQLRNVMDTMIELESAILREAKQVKKLLLKTR